MSKHQIPKKISNNANSRISSSIMVLQTHTMTLGKLVIKCPPKHREDYLITIFPNVVVLLINIYQYC